jgi:hypothetical protein
MSPIQPKIPNPICSILLSPEQWAPQSTPLAAARPLRSLLAGRSSRPLPAAPAPPGVPRPGLPPVPLSRACCSPAPVTSPPPIPWPRRCIEGGTAQAHAPTRRRAEHRELGRSRAAEHRRARPRAAGWCRGLEEKTVVAPSHLKSTWACRAIFALNEDRGCSSSGCNEWRWCAVKNWCVVVLCVLSAVGEPLNKHVVWALVDYFNLYLWTLVVFCYKLVTYEHVMYG